MGEFALYHGERVKIGTCESMYYLRADQAGEVEPVSGSVDPVRHGKAGDIRFRFPWPDEDDCAPGSDFHERSYKRSLALRGVAVPEGVEHYTVQFVAQAGYNVCLPCPESGDTSHGLHVHRNGFSGAVKLIQQKWYDGQLIGICECGGCGALYRLETPEMMGEAVEALLGEVESKRHQERLSAEHHGHEPNPDAGRFYLEVAKRLAAGYGVLTLAE